MTLYDLRLPTVQQMRLAKSAFEVLATHDVRGREIMRFPEPVSWEERFACKPEDSDPGVCEAAKIAEIEVQPRWFNHRYGGTAAPTQDNRDDGHLKAFKITPANGEAFLYVPRQDRVLVPRNHETSTGAKD